MSSRQKNRKSRFSFYPSISINPVVFGGRCPEEIAINKNIYRQETYDISSSISVSTSAQSGFSVTHKVGNVDIFVSLNFKNKIDKAIFLIARNSGCGKVMFSQACVKNSVRGVYASMQWAEGVSASGSRDVHPPGHTPPRQTPPDIPCPWANTSWADTPRQRWPLKREVRILLECIIVII